MQEQLETDHEGQKANKNHDKAPPASVQQSVVEEPSRDNQKKGYFSKIENWINLLTLIFVGTYTVLTWRALHTAQEQVNISRDTEKRQLRAYILPSESTIIVSSPNNLKMHLVFKNFGLTPAHKFVGWNCMIIGRFNKDEYGNIGIETQFPVPPFDEKTAPPTTVGPQDTKTVFFPSFCDGGVSKVRSITSDEVLRIQSGKAAIYIYGEQSYIDVFGQRHYIKYRMVGLGGGGTFDATEGNDSD